MTRVSSGPSPYGSSCWFTQTVETTMMQSTEKTAANQPATVIQAGRGSSGSASSASSLAGSAPLALSAPAFATAFAMSLVYPIQGILRGSS